MSLQLGLTLLLLSAAALICLRRPDIVARFLASSTSVKPGQESTTPAEELAMLIRQGSPEWKTKYPQFYHFIKGIGWVALGFLVLLALGLLLNGLMTLWFESL